MNKDAIGVDLDGQKIRFDTNFSWVLCVSRNLRFLEVPNGVQMVNCEGNSLKTLILPDSVDELTCDKELIDYDECRIFNVEIYYE